MAETEKPRAIEPQTQLSEAQETRLANRFLGLAENTVGIVASLLDKLPRLREDPETIAQVMEVAATVQRAVFDGACNICNITRDVRTAAISKGYEDIGSADRR